MDLWLRILAGVLALTCAAGAIVQIYNAVYIRDGRKLLRLFSAAWLVYGVIIYTPSACCGVVMVSAYARPFVMALAVSLLAYGITELPPARKK